MLKALLSTKRDLILENVALQQQLSIYKRTGKRPRLRPSERVFWVGLSKVWGNWRSALIVVKPDTVIRWHRQGFRLIWRWRSRNRKGGRPHIPRRDIELIKRISRENPAWGEDKIALELRLKLGVEHSTSTIRRYMVRSRDPKRRQTWAQFITNHGKEIYACDFLTQYTALFGVVYIFVVMELASRRIVHLNVSESPGLDWVKQQIRHVASVGEEPKYLIHDNDGIFGQFGKRRRVEGRRGTSQKSYRCHLDWWLETVMGIKGIPIPYGAPNANSRLERFHRTLRQEALNHFIFFSEEHVRRV